MTREEALNILHNASVYHPNYLDALNMAIKALEQELTIKNDKIDCERTDCNNCVNHKYCDYESTTKNDLGVDCISRAEALKCLECDFNITGKENMKTVVNYINSTHDKIVNLPRVKQEPKTGHWIPTYGNVKCSVCGSVKDSREVGKATHYCDFCGAKMESEEE